MMSNKIITYVFTSPCGGVGKTTMSVACAKAHALQGRRILYVNCDNFEKAQDYFNGESNIETTDAGVKIWETIESEKDKTYDEMIVNMPFQGNDTEFKMIKNADELILISTATKEANDKLKRCLEVLPPEEYEDRLSILYNKFDNEKSIMFDDFPGVVLGGAPQIEEADMQSVINVMTDMNFFNILSKITAEKERKLHDALMYGETTVLEESLNPELQPQMGETTVLMHPYLVRMKNGERISINKAHFLIGKEHSSVGYFVSDNAAVSRRHAEIVTKNSDFYIVDKRSTNHTYINGMIIAEETPVRLRNGAHIRLGNEDFEFWEECV